MTRFLYLHGFASGPRSTKGMAFAEHYAGRGVAVERLDLRVPSFERPRLSAMIEATRAAIGGDRAVLFGSSLGGLAAARAAERDARVVALVLLAPAFRLVERWRRLDPAFGDWERTGWREVLDHATGRQARVDFGFVEDARAIDAGYPQVRVPILVLHGRRDATVDVAWSRDFAAGRPNVRLVELDDGHDLVASLPRLLEESDAFLSPWLG